MDVPEEKRDERVEKQASVAVDDRGDARIDSRPRRFHAYAAQHINGGSIQKQTIGGGKLKQKTLTGFQINLNKLGRWQPRSGRATPTGRF